MISLAKLTLMASSDDPSVQEKIDAFDMELELISVQEDLMSSVGSAHGFDPDNPQVMRPSEIIKVSVIMIRE